MHYERIAKTKSGCLWLLNAKRNGFAVEQFEGRRVFQRNLTDLIIKDVLGDVHLTHSENGAPILKGENSGWISISHSEDWFAVYHSKKEPVGVDVEVVGKELNRYRKYFLNQTESVREWTDYELYKIWCAKETVFKLKSGNMRQPIQEVIVHNILPKTIKTTCNKAEQELTYFQLDDVLIVHS